VKFQEALDWLNDSQFTGIKLGLDNTHRLLAAIGNPHQRLRFLHVAGTNGKGSVCAMLDSCLREAAHRTGLYTSPHLVDFRERIRVDGVKISEQETAHGLTRLREAAETWDHKPTFFELSTVLAFDHFERAGCDVVVLETGMGGRLDSTNVVAPLVSVITPIAIDHMAWLGDNIAKIAAEKAGIIKLGVPVISSPQQASAAEVLTAKALETASEIRFIDAPTDIPVALTGTHQLWNAAVAIAALDASGLHCPPEAIANARELAALEALVARVAPAAEASAPRPNNVVALRPRASSAQEDPKAALQTALREVMEGLTPRHTLVLTRIFGLDLAPRNPLIEGCRLDAVTLAESLGVSTTAIYLDMVLAAERLREPSRAARLRPFYDALKAQDKRGGDVRLLRFLFDPKR
jgi:hypothetical protein